MRTLIIDNYDSFTFNLVHMIAVIDEEPVVVRNDAIDLTGVRELSPDRIIISPGPGSPENADYFGVCTEVIREFGCSTPILGVCLGHQGIGVTFGGRIVRAPHPTHGKTRTVVHEGTDVFAGLPLHFDAMLYHSLAVDSASLPACLVATAHCMDGEIMGLRHREFPIFGVQFHPESFGTLTGPSLLKNFLFGAWTHV
jgi:anthranilate synthase/aminodeoxychorismate synthase-like glutamine amidotransferase